MLKKGIAPEDNQRWNTIVGSDITMKGLDDYDTQPSYLW